MGWDMCVGGTLFSFDKLGTSGFCDNEVICAQLKTILTFVVGFDTVV